jgi:putative tributyrin esterase
MPVKILGEISSGLMHRVLPYCALLPNGYENSGECYPVLYILHGLFGRHDDWVERTGLAEEAFEHKLIIVTPEGGDGWYTDSATVPEEKYESYLVNELLPEIDGRYRTIGQRAGRAIAGLSMGGYGAFKLGFKRPELFALAASFSGAFDAPGRSDDAPGFDWESLRPSVLRAFGKPGSRTRSENDLYRIVEELPGEKVPELPFFYFDCGTEDGFLQANLRLKAALATRDIAHRFQQVDGCHDWEYWGQRVRPLLSLAATLLVQPAGRSGGI